MHVVDLCMGPDLCMGLGNGSKWTATLVTVSDQLCLEQNAARCRLQSC